MAKIPVDLKKMIADYGPHVNGDPVNGWNAKLEPDELFKTHCCYCGMQCGIQLAVKNNQVIGFEPWEEFPFNQGRLCPKGVKRYMQTHHPDRLTDPLLRTEKGFVKISWEEALNFITKKIKNIQEKYGKDAMAMMSGVSLSNEKSYLMGKFARLALQTKNLDYNGRFCMVSAGGGNKKAFGVDRAANSWEDIPKAKVLFIAGSNVSECFPTLMHYIWKARDFGAKLIIVDPRVTPIARTADYHLQIRPGTDSALYQSLLHLLIKNNHIDQEFINNYCSGWEELKNSVVNCTPEWAAEICGVNSNLIKEVAQVWGETSTSFALHARGIEQQTKGVENVLGVINLVLATGRIGKEGCGYGTITGQGNGQGGREHGHKCEQLPGNRDIENPEHRAYICKVWGITDSELPRKGYTAVELFEAIERKEIHGLLNICCNPMVSHPDTNFVRKTLENAEFVCVIDFFMSETARYADIVLPGSLQEEEEGTTTSAEGRVCRIRKVVEPPLNAKADTWIILEIAKRLGREKYFNFNSSEDIFNELRVASKGGTADYFGITWDKVEQNMGVFWPCPSLDHPGTPRLFENKKSFHADGKFHLHPTPYRLSFEVPDSEYPVYYTSGRSVFHYLSGNQTRRIKFLVDKYKGPICEMHPQLAKKFNLLNEVNVTVESRRGSITLPLKITEAIREDTVFVPYHWAEKLAANQITVKALDPISKMPEYKVCACRVRKPTDDEIKQMNFHYSQLDLQVKNQQN